MPRLALYRPGCQAKHSINGGRRPLAKLTECFGDVQTRDGRYDQTGVPRHERITDAAMVPKGFHAVHCSEDAF